MKILSAARPQIKVDHDAAAKSPFDDAHLLSHLYAKLTSLLSGQQRQVRLVSQPAASCTLHTGGGGALP